MHTVHLLTSDRQTRLKTMLFRNFNKYEHVVTSTHPTPNPEVLFPMRNHFHCKYVVELLSRRKVQSQYISKNVRALQYWRWACGTCCKQYHMLFYIQMAVVSTAIFFLFSPSFSFFLEIKVQIYIYFHNKCQYIKQFPPKL